MDQIEKEFPSLSPKGRIESTPDAYRRAMLEDPYREIQKHAKELGMTQVAEEMGQLAVEAGEAVSKADIKNERLETGEERLLGEIIESAGYGVEAHMSRSVKVRPGFRGSHAPNNDWTSLGNEKFRWEVPSRGFPDPQSYADKMLKYLAENNHVAELFTIVRNPNDKYKALPGQSVIQYETLTRNNGYFSSTYKDHYGRPGNKLRCLIQLDVDLADKLFEAAKKNPELVHRLVDRFMKDQILEEGGSWADARPPFDEWREHEGGIARMAFAEGSLRAIDQAEIIEY